MRIGRIEYCEHLTERLRLREIDEALPRQVIRQARQVFRDTATGYRIAIAPAPYLGETHLMMVVFEIDGDVATAITVHPLEERDVEAKVRNGRWQP